MSTRISLFNHKGGVSKTTTTFNLGWKLANMGEKVIIVDTDPQCNLTGLVLGYQSQEEFENFYEDENERNLRSGLEPAFESQPRQIEPVDCIQVEGNENLYLLPGHIRLSEYESTLGIAQELTGSITTLQNLPGAPSHLLEVTAERFDADYVLIDMNPSLSSINQNLLMTSQYFIIPCSPDYFSLMAINSLSQILPDWKEWSEQAQEMAVLEDATYPYPSINPKLIGTIMQNYRVRKGSPTIGFQERINEINTAVRNQLAPVLDDNEMLLSEEKYDQILENEDYCLSLVPDFNTLVTKSEDSKTPVYDLSEDQIDEAGIVLDNQKEKRDDFNRIFEDMSRKVISAVS